MTSHSTRLSLVLCALLVLWSSPGGAQVPAPGPHLAGADPLAPATSLLDAALAELARQEASVPDEVERDKRRGVWFWTGVGAGIGAGIGLAALAGCDGNTCAAAPIFTASMGALMGLLFGVGR